ncbi:1-deoxy-D-xylulose-5-phosphate synthase [Lachnospiraceae bacterium]|nr:1-deoxy-D-xylulose-5-phosphate synthase [Lachnospiraceae bacterium]
MQRAYLSKLLELAENNADVLHLVADSGTGFDEMFKHSFPGQMINFGIAEEHMVAASAGLATAGKIPFVYTAGAFLAYRSLEFIRNDICFQNLNVKIVGMGSGLAWCSLGPTHHTTEDIAVLRAIPNLMILSPATPVQVSQCVELAYRHTGPVYIRIGMNNEKEFFAGSHDLPASGQNVLRGGGNIVILSTGNILENVLSAADELEKDNLLASVINIVRIKPFDETALFQEIMSADYVVTVEEHNICGGLGSIAAEALASSGMGKKLIRIGLNDIFAEGYGNSQEIVRAQNGLDAAAIAETIRRRLRE